jgi:hypothetical protein
LSDWKIHLHKPVVWLEKGMGTMSFWMLQQTITQAFQGRQTQMGSLIVVHNEESIAPFYFPVRQCREAFLAVCSKYSHICESRNWVPPLSCCTSWTVFWCRSISEVSPPPSIPDVPTVDKILLDDTTQFQISKKRFKKVPIVALLYVSKKDQC